MIINVKPFLLVIDDQCNNLSAFKANFRHDYNIVMATNFPEALNTLHTQKIDIIFCEERILNSSFSGLEFFDSISKDFPKVIKIITSGSRDSDRLLKAAEDKRIYSFVPKPWDIEEICLTIKRATKNCVELSSY